MQVHPAGASTDWNVVLGGVASVKFDGRRRRRTVVRHGLAIGDVVPGEDGGGRAAVLRTRSAWVAVATTSVAIAEFAPNDWLVAFTVAVSVMIVPAGGCGANFVDDRECSRDACAHAWVRYRVAGNPAQVHPAGGVIETKVVFAGSRLGKCTRRLRPRSRYLSLPAYR